MTLDDGFLRYDTVSFLSDYGIEDEFVGVVHSVLRSIVPGVGVIDITHGVNPHDIRAGSLALARSAPYLCPGVVLAVVDPGVGSGRLGVGVEVGGGESVLVGPDNGLLASAVAMVGGADRAVSLTNKTFHLDSPGNTFDGRDIFAPVAAHLCRGVDLAEFGESIEPGLLVPSIIPVSNIELGTLHAEVLWIDRFGNVQLNIDPAELPGDTVEVRIGGLFRSARLVNCFDELGSGALGLLVDSTGLVSLVLSRASAASELAVCVGDSVVLSLLEPENVGAVTAVELGRRGHP